jgi:SPP1 family predicted phage head-tail adaptor
MEAGKLDRRIRIDERTVVQDGIGGETETWVERATVWAEKRDLSGRELILAQQEAATATTRFVIRFRDDVAQTDRIVYDGVNHDIQHIAEIGRGEGLEILAKREV